MQMSVATNDHDIRNALKRLLDRRFASDPETLIVNELGVSHGAARIDVAVVNGAIHGYELKSDSDTLARLPSQVQVFSSVLDYITLVVGRRHLHKAAKMVPAWWGIRLAAKGPRRGVAFCDIRRPRRNPSPDMLAVAKLLWRQEALSILSEMGASDGFRSKPRAAIYARLVEVMSPTTLRAKVRSQLRCRASWRLGERQRPDGG